ncbi:MAG: efflux RND transporter periplasmic adaptor subunit [Tannerellaceae bacterium]|jgi:RND family efflux transporter MFP subunit|nr:efflux RND transporter periplasmic adaptor subunit [Tannerellaceae bacterium]
MKSYLKWYIAALATCTLAACSGEKGTETQERIIPVKIVEISASPVKGEQNYVGTVEESVAVSLSFPGTGTVEQALVYEGQRVSKGQLLATLNTVTAQNACDVSQANLVQAQDAYDRLAKVHESGSLPDIKFAEVEAGLQQAKSMAAIARKSLDDCKMYAPMSGVIATRSIEAGANVMPGTTAFKLVSVDRVNVRISVPENEIGSVRTGQAASITVPALNQAVFTGKIETKGIAANAMSHAYGVKIGIDRADATTVLPLPGMVCKVLLTDDGYAAAFVVPNRAIRIATDGQKFVWLADGNTARRRFVKTGDLTTSGIIVTEGLSAGDRILVEGFQKVSEGTGISIKN